MKIELSDVSAVKKIMTVEVPPEVVDKERESVVRGYAAKARIPGFRPGKAPLSMIRTRFAKELREDVRERVLTRAYAEAAKERGIRPITDPVLDEIHDEEGQPFRFKTTFEVLPKIELKNYKEIEVRERRVAVGDDDVQKMLEELQQSRTLLVLEEGRKAASGDVLVADIEGTPEDGEPFRRERLMIELGATDNLPAFNEQLEGLAAGEEKVFSVDYPQAYAAKELAGKTVAYKITVHEVKRREVPEIDDEFAKDLGEFDNLDALKTRIREDLEVRQRREIDGEVRQSLLQKLLTDHPLVLPEALVEQEIRRRLEELARNLVMQGIDLEKADLDWKDVREKQEGPARKSVHARLLLDAVARAEDLKVSDEDLDARIEHDALQLGQKPAELRRRMERSGGPET
ncbi:MAG: trigger factor, partial [Acidobacteria bacterium]|nr:trigger factor [Acidobacteriota bacterium]